MAKKRPTDQIDPLVDVNTPDPMIQEMVKSDEDARFYAAADALANTAPEPVSDEKPLETTEIVSQNVDFVPELEDFTQFVYPSMTEHLKIIEEYRSITVPTFRDLTQSGREAISILAGYVEDGLVARDWQNGYGRYSLTDAGQQYIQQ